MPRIRRFLAAIGVVALGSGMLGSCASASGDADRSDDGRDLSLPQASDVREADPSLLIFGDSWTYGLAASRPDGGYAYLTGELLGWDTTVDGENGSGYLRTGQHGGTYGPRAAQLDPVLDPDIVVVQGSINDRRQDLSRFRSAVDEAWNTFTRHYPDADIVVLGPAPHALPVEPGILRVEEMLRAAAADHHLPYISPLADEWITTANYDAVIDTSPEGNAHPSDAGHAYLAERLVDALGELTIHEEPLVALEETETPVERG